MFYSYLVCKVPLLDIVCELLVLSMVGYLYYYVNLWYCMLRII